MPTQRERNAGFAAALRVVDQYVPGMFRAQISDAMLMYLVDSVLDSVEKVRPIAREQRDKS